MKKLAILGAFIALQAHAEPATVEIDVPALCKANWSVFETKEWVNQTGKSQSIASLKFQVVGADTLEGEFGLWLAGSLHGLLYSYGTEAYRNPDQAMSLFIQPFPDARFHIYPGERVSLRVNCGQVGHDANWRQFNYFGVVQMQLIPVL